MKKNYYFENEKFIIRDFGKEPPFTGFLPGIAGLKGCPVWAFYINRGQGIAGFGVGGKEHPVMEFCPAEIAYANSPRQGFRTFLRVDGKPFEPFRVGGSAPTRMQVYRSGFAIEESAAAYRLRAEYFGVPDSGFAALGRIVNYTNTTSFTQTVEILDGIAQILPYGISNAAFKETGNLLKSWMTAKGMEEGYSYVKMRSSTADCADVSGVSGGNFFLPVGDYGVAVDPKIIFGEDRTKTSAKRFNRNGLSKKELSEQCGENLFFCSFAYKVYEIKPGDTVALCELCGYAPDIETVRELKKSLTPQDVLTMRDKAARTAEDIAAHAETHTAFPLFDEYVKQSYFDNVLRGGMPVLVGGKPYYVYSRKHGDPERDYNAFQIEPKPYSCGNGNFRDVAQNRRNDLFFTPECGSFNVKYFFSLLQADGYNPLSVLGVRFTCKNVPARYKPHEKFLKSKFTVGDAVMRLGIDDAHLDELISMCEPVYEAKFSEGFWTDHFVYLIDLVTAYLSVYPDKKDELLFKARLKWFNSGMRVLPRSRRAVKTGDGKIRRLYSLEKAGEDGWLKAGAADYETSLAAKLLFLVLIKISTLDPLGCGIDMEAGKPGWCDALNGLPAVFGSNVADCVELLRLTETVKALLSEGNIEWATEQNDFFNSVLALLESKSSEKRFYELSNDYKEIYLACVYKGFGGATAIVTYESAQRFLTAACAKLKRGLARAKELGGGWLPTYLSFGVEKYKETEEGFVIPEVFVPRALPHFAEGVAKGLAYEGTELYKQAKRSELYDKKLKLFRTSEPLDGETLEIGRIRSFPAGWLERESCFLHMSYKLLLALLKAGLYEEFYSEMRTGFVPFMNPDRYGRNTLENSSFIATSNYADRSLWGKGFQARLTGANSEVLSMWRLMAGFENPFEVRDGKLNFSLSPKLHKDFFKEGKVSFRLFGNTKITYINRSGKSTWEGTNIANYILKGERIFETATVTAQLAEDVRAGKFKEIEVEIQ